MTDLTHLFVAMIALAGLLALISVWSQRRLMVKAIALGVLVLFLPLGYAALADLLSRPKPVSLEWAQANAKEATVLGSQVQENKAIHLWLQLPDTQEPRAYVLPWDRKTAERLQQATREAMAQGGKVKMRLPFEPSLEDREPKFYALPQPAPPPKDLTQPAPQYYNGPPGRGA